MILLLAGDAGTACPGLGNRAGPASRPVSASGRSPEVEQLSEPDHWPGRRLLFQKKQALGKSSPFN